MHKGQFYGCLLLIIYKKLPSSRHKHLAGTVLSVVDTRVLFSIQCQTQSVQEIQFCLTAVHGYCQ
jgi:hypothetical protein